MAGQLLYSPAFTLAGDVGFGVGFMGGLLAVLIAAAMFFLAWAIYTTRHPRKPAEAPGWYRSKGLYVMAMVIVFISLSAFTYPFIPVVSFSKLQPTQFVSVQAQQFSWTFNTTKIIAGQPVEFIVTSKDVTHGFGVYSPTGTLLLQEQVMPGFDNDFVYTFTKPGIYTVRCLEYCGFGHPYMVTTFAVVTG